MKKHVASLMVACVFSVRAIGASPTNFSEAHARVLKQGMGEASCEYLGQFMTSVCKKLDAAIEEGATVKGKSSFDVIFLVAADGRIVNAFLSKPDKQPLGKYVAVKLLGVKAPKPPKDNWAVYFSMTPRRKSSFVPTIRPNQALQPTADRLENSHMITSTLKFGTQLALVSGG
jgi:hypothetical protein